jgi:hypothetical protein
MRPPAWVQRGRGGAAIHVHPARMMHGARPRARIGPLEWTLAIVALAVLAIAALSPRISSGPLTPAILFVAIGIIVGPRVLGEADVSLLSMSVRTLAEATLTLVLFADVSRINVHVLRRDHGLPLPPARDRAAADDRRRAAFGAILLDDLTLLEALVQAWPTASPPRSAARDSSRRSSSGALCRAGRARSHQHRCFDGGRGLDVR